MPALSAAPIAVLLFPAKPARAPRCLGALSMSLALTLGAAGAGYAADGTFGSDALAAWQKEWQEEWTTERQSLGSAFELTTAVRPQLGDLPGSGGMGRSLAAGSNASNATQHLDLTRWLTPQSPQRFGVTLGLSGPAPPSAPPSPTTGSTSGSQPPPMQLDLGVRWRSQLQPGRHLDVSAWAQTPDTMGLIWQTQPPTYGTRVEVQWASSRTRGLVPEFGAIGVQLQGSSRLVLRARKGGPMLYYRAKF
ncbi:hypothetical protein [Paracidovorax sp. MALMAid1276]|uniref:hypothetical protein n=1 Tax=Paracidovorax sp. MALMAid1276 TaxID=3411631 RepID=UPI003B9D5367